MTTAGFALPAELAGRGPVHPRDDVRLLVSGRSGTVHARFAELAAHLEPGDLIVVNTSATLPAAVPAHRASGRAALVHFSSALDDGSWVVELRPARRATGPLPDVRAGEQLLLAGNVSASVLEAYPDGQSRLWRLRVEIEGDVRRYLAKQGRPIRYAYLPRPVPLREYQTVFAEQVGAGLPGSAEMPSAARPFTNALITRLVVRGVVIAPLVLHTGVSSQNDGEPPMPEPFEVPPSTARLVNVTRAAGGRVVGVGTTVTRALESAADANGITRATRGWTDLVLGPDRPARVVRGLVTGWHAPGASHLRLLEAVAGAELVDAAYAEAVRERYMWHEFGDSCLLLP